MHTKTTWLLNAVPSRLDEGPGRHSTAAAPARAGRFLVNGKPVSEAKKLTMHAGDVVLLETPGGGGYGPPAEISPDDNEKRPQREEEQMRSGDLLTIVCGESRRCSWQCRAAFSAQDYKIGISAGLTGYAATVDRAWRDGVEVAAAASTPRAA